MTVRILLALLCLLAFATSAPAKSEIWLAGTFSSLRFNTEGGDLDSSSTGC